MNNLPNLGQAIGSLKVIRSTTGVVALLLVLLVVILIASWAFPLTETQRYVVMGLAFGSGFLVWLFYWLKARSEPLASTEKYLIAQLPYLYGQKTETETLILTREAAQDVENIEPQDIGLLPQETSED